MADRPPPGGVSARWLSANPDKARAERLFLLYTPVWMTAVGLVMLTGWIHTFGDLGFMVFSIAVAVPALVTVLFDRNADRPWWRSDWFKLNAWSAILVFGGTDFGTAYFFDLIGTRYGFDVASTSGSPLGLRSSWRPGSATHAPTDAGLRRQRLRPAHGRVPPV